MKYYICRWQIRERGRGDQTKVLYMRHTLTFFSWGEVFRIIYLQKKYIPSLNKIMDPFLIGYFISRNFLPYKCTLCKFLVLKNICVINASSMLLS